MPTAYITAPSDAADDIATTLVEERLAACVIRSCVIIFGPPRKFMRFAG